MVGSPGRHIHPAGLEPGNQTTTDKAVIEMHAPRPVLADPAIAAFGTGLQMRLDIRGQASPRRASVIGVVPPDHGDVFWALRLHVEIAHDKKVLRQRRIGHGEFDRTRQRSSLGEVAKDTLLEKGDLRDALIRRDMVEMHGIDTQRTARSGDDNLKRTTLQVQPVEGAAARQKQVAAAMDRIARQQHVAELEAPLAQPAVDHRVIHQHVAGRTEGHEVIGKLRGKGLDKIGIAVPAIAARHLLKSDHVSITDAVGNTIGVESTILTEPILDVVAHELHDTL